MKLHRAVCGYEAERKVSGVPGGAERTSTGLISDKHEIDIHGARGRKRGETSRGPPMETCHRGMFVMVRLDYIEGVTRLTTTTVGRQTK